MGGVVVSRQRPPTARGTAFLALEDEGPVLSAALSSSKGEDEGGLINVALRAKVYETSRKAQVAVRGSRGAIAEAGPGDRRAGATGGGGGYFGFTQDRRGGVGGVGVCGCGSVCVGGGVSVKWLDGIHVERDALEVSVLSRSQRAYRDVGVFLPVWCVMIQPQVHKITG